MTNSIAISHGPSNGSLPSETTATVETELPPCELTPEQKRKWEDTSTMMGWTCPAFRHIWYKLLDNNSGSYTAVVTEAAGIAATDGKNILIAPSKFFGFSLAGGVFCMGTRYCTTCLETWNCSTAAHYRVRCRCTMGLRSPSRTGHCSTQW